MALFARQGARCAPTNRNEGIQASSRKGWRQRLLSSVTVTSPTLVAERAGRGTLSHRYTPQRLKAEGKGGSEGTTGGLSPQKLEREVQNGGARSAPSLG